MTKRNTLICTVGTSLFGNLGRLPEENPLRQAYDNGAWNKLARELLDVGPTERVCGAEINTVESVQEKKWLTLERLLFLVSDTPDGRNTGKVLKEYFTQRSLRRHDIDLNSVEYCVIDKLQDERPKDFKVHGLRNLVRQAGEYIQRFGGSESVAIDATGGYKAQIAIAVILGQALNIPVFYKHERFSEIIDFPPLPISFDYQILASHADLFTDLERGVIFGASEIGPFDDKLRVLLTEITEDNGEGETLYALSPIGQIYLTGFRARNPKPFHLVDAADRKPPTFRDDHYPTGFKEFVKKVWRENLWIRTANSLPYDKQKSIKGIGFSVKQDAEEKLRLVGTFQDKDTFGARFWLHITNESLDALTWAAEFLNRQYRPY